ncbi:MAG: DinB family protein [Acidobacteria bacterium]|nr:DinB family protein [Acidobacteriota bacterium]
MNAALATLDRELAASLSGLTSAQTQFRLSNDPSQWSIHQIAQHLLLTYRSTITAFESRIAKGTPTRSRPTLSQRLAQFVVVTLGKMPGRRKAPPEVAPIWPDIALAGDALAESASEALAQLDTILDQASSIFGSIPCQSHFALGPLTPAQWSRFHLSHGRHHIRQIMAIRQARRF